MSDRFTDLDIPQQPQRQDAFDHQLQTVYGAAVRLGCYDVADWINRSLSDRQSEAQRSTIGPDGSPGGSVSSSRP